MVGVRGGPPKCIIKPLTGTLILPLLHGKRVISGHCVWSFMNLFKVIYKTQVFITKSYQEIRTVRLKKTFRLQALNFCKLEPLEVKLMQKKPINVKLIAWYNI